MAENIVFSVIIPTYNRANRLEFALDSLVNQTYKNFEVIVCDDGSTDNTLEVVDLFKERLDLTYCWEENWGGPARPRNRGLIIARGDWICFLDADDWWLPNKLEECKKYIGNNDIIYHSLSVYHKSSNSVGKKLRNRQLKENAFLDLMVNRNAIANSSVVIRKELLIEVGGFSEDKNLIAVEDYDLWIKLSLLTNKFFYVRKVLGYYFLDDYNISGNYRLNILRQISVFKKYAHLLEKKDLYKAKGYLFYVIGMHFVWIKRFLMARKYFNFALFRGSFFTRIKAFIKVIQVKRYF